MNRGFIFLAWVAGLFFLTGCGKKEEVTPPTTNTASSGNPLTAPVDYLGAAANAKKSAEKTLDTAGLNQAIQMFYATEGRYPKTLNELVGTGQLSKLPSAPAGMKYDYNPKTGQVKVVPQ